MPLPSDQEQLLLEYINDARLDPMGNAARYLLGYSPLQSADPDIQNALTAFGVNGQALLAAFSSLVPAQPLAWNSSLSDAATAHSGVMIATDSQTHQAPGEPGLGQRAVNAGYATYLLLGENVFAFGSSMLQAHAAFMVDWGFGPNGMQNPAGHRISIMNNTFREIGVSALQESNPATSVGTWVVTQNFGVRWDGPQAILLGVSYNDLDGNRFFSPGEGRSNVAVNASGVTGQSSSSGGYSLGLTAGTKNITFSGGGLASPLSVVADLPNGTNAKIDVVGSGTLLTSISLTLVSGVTKVAALGVQDLRFNGNGFAQEMVGNSGDNHFHGLSGVDTLDGGAGSDTSDYSEKAGSITVTLNGAVAMGVRVAGVLEDFVKNVENIVGGMHNDTFIGDAQNNRFMGGGGRDGLDGGAGTDTIDLSDMSGAISLTLLGSSAATVYQSGVWEDRVKNIENIRSGSGNDTLIGDSFNNTFRGGGGRDGIDGAGGSDTADFSDLSGPLSVTLSGSVTATVYQNGLWEDRIKNIENLVGGSGNDSFIGDAASNSFFGGAGNDTLNGGLGSDLLVGGAGADRFVFSAAIGGTNTDTLPDFQAGTDKIALDDDVFTTLGVVGTVNGVGLTASRFQLGASADDAMDRIVFNSATGQLFYDADGSGVSVQQQIALIGGAPPLSASDFLVVA